MTFHFAGSEVLVAGGVLPDGGFTGGVGGDSECSYERGFVHLTRVEGKH
jgi:hypothetical protein